MAIAVIIPTFQEEQTIPLTLNALADLKMDEVIVVDGGSRDHTKAIADRYFSQTNNLQGKAIMASRGRALQMNAGAAASRADILLFLHADTRLPDNGRTMIEQVMKTATTVGGRFDVQFEVDRGYAWLISRMMNLRSRWTGIATGDQAIFVRRDIFSRLGGFSNIPIMEDIDFSRRLKQAGTIVALHSKVTTSFRRWERGGPLRTILCMWILRFLFGIGISPRILQQFYGTVR